MLLNTPNTKKVFLSNELLLVDLQVSSFLEFLTTLFAVESLADGWNLTSKSFLSGLEVGEVGQDLSLSQACSLADWS